jgi:NADH dehydrogenase (ubiquinone) Fe-S protein 5
MSGTLSTYRCYPIWMDFSQCMSEADSPKQCKDYRDDYLECLHHRKEFAKMNAMFRAEKSGGGHGS